MTLSDEMFARKLARGGRAGASGTNSAYSSTFAAAETPLSEGGAWVKLTPEGGASDHTGWHGVITSGGNALPRYNAGSTGGGPLAGEYDDCYAYLSGTWVQNMRAEATVYRGAGSKEVELLFCVWDQASPARVKAYEGLFDLGAGSVEINRWNGDPTDFTIMSTFSPGTRADGDRVRLDISWSGDIPTLTAYYSLAASPTTWVLVGSHTDSSAGRLPHGAPGIGFFARIGESLDYGLKDYSVVAT